MSSFSIKILDQGWLDPAAPDYDPLRHDLCSHGEILLVIGGQTIAEAIGERGYGISESALALLRTLESDHTPQNPVAERLIPHGCGTMLMFGCPIGIDWVVSHAESGKVRLHDVLKYETTDESLPIRFPDLAAELSEDEYRFEVAAFAKRAKEPFEGVEKAPFDDFDRQMYADFWEEYDSRLQSALRES